ncbi:MAG: ATPase [Lachnospiraceae bacterium]|nr:ATPase [Lachnospiraceae bacterium]
MQFTHCTHLLSHIIQYFSKEVSTILYQRILSEHQRLEEQIHAIRHQLKDFPNENLICTRDGKYQKWYQSNGHTQSYIPKKNRQLAEQLALKKYLSLLAEDLSHEKRALDFYLRHHRQGTNQADALLLNDSEYQKLLLPLFTPLYKELSDWQNSDFSTNPKYPEQLSIKTSSGHFVRSKSEALIDMALFTHRIPFRYECALVLGDNTFYPDFTIRHPHTGDTYYWEHFGLMDNPTYCRNVSFKLQQYSLNGIIPSIHLITTYETKENPLSSEVIEKIIDHYFL